MGNSMTRGHHYPLPQNWTEELCSSTTAVRKPADSRVGISSYIPLSLPTSTSQTPLTVNPSGQDEPEELLLGKSGKATTYLLHFLAFHGATDVNHKNQVLAHVGQVFGCKEVCKVIVGHLEQKRHRKASLLSIFPRSLGLGPQVVGLPRGHRTCPD